MQRLAPMAYDDPFFGVLIFSVIAMIAGVFLLTRVRN
jgi:hypothetical protein